MPWLSTLPWNMPPRMASAPVGVFTVTPPSFLESLPPTKRSTPLPRVATISPLFLLGS